MKVSFCRISLVIFPLILFTTACSNSESEQAKQKEKDLRSLENKTPTLKFEIPEGSKVIKPGSFIASARTTVLSEKGNYHVTLHSQVSPIPKQKIHSWLVHIETVDSKPLKQATIYIHGGMPAHRHGFPVQPRVKQNLGNGDFRIEGVKFSMLGEWEMRININTETIRDRAVFKINID